MANGGGKIVSPNKIAFNYIKTPNYRTYHVDGVYGGTTPSGKVFAELFVERRATPQVVSNEINKDGTLGKEITKEGKEGIVRQIEASLLMDIDTARSFAGWLIEKVQLVEKMAAQTKQ